MVTQDRDEELALFLEMRRRDKEHGASLLTGSDSSSNNEAVSSLRYPLRRTAAENFLYSENEKSDYEWLLTPPGTPQYEKESHRSAMNQFDGPNARPTVLKSRLGNCREEPVSRASGVSSKHSMLSPGPNSSEVAGTRRPSSSGGLKSASRPSSSGGLKSTSRPSTPTRRSTTTTATVTSKTTKASSSRSSTPTSRAALTASRPAGPSRSATPTRSIMPRSSSTQSLPAAKPVSRSATPTRRPSTPSGPSSAAATKVTNSANRPAQSRGASPTVRSRPWKPPEMPGFSLEAPPNLRTTLPERPLSASRGRPAASAPSSRSNSIERSGGGNGRVRRQSCSPSRGRAPIGNPNGSIAVVPTVRGRAKGSSSSSGDSVSPVAMGSKMVERVVNMRKLAPPRQSDRSNGKPISSLDSLGYGRNLSKSSLDMALRHMDIRRSFNGNLRPLVTKVPASSMYSVRTSTSGRSRTTSVSDSPLATTSSPTSSEPSVNNINILCLDGSEAENDDLLSERGNSSPLSQLGKISS
ncbi:PREDICTED: nascent polypeptide-associated complex subunit alpha, muscle-specific form [Tarenaya hassleriana]|uniref:nascent polypeptide-associated complex subunit alpha, muscle-specific form n=1 Tax=Tarenaya hassleriana TaxID=28532 RepID=UPI00053C7ED8|nr:PREDICTED: nascent polypeptide-associated complex subunit alpha, muscle-specific form [Tarenaya hassleriana]